MNGITEFDSTHQTIYAFARCEQWLRDFTETHGLAYNVLTQRVAALLHSTAGGEVLGVEDNMPPLRTDSTTGSEATPEVEVVEHPHRKAQVKRKVGRPKGKFVCVKCKNMSFTKFQDKQKHYYYVHGAGKTSPNAKSYKDAAWDYKLGARKSVKAVKPIRRRRPSTPRDIECKLCHEMIPNVSMGNHMRYVHKNKPMTMPVQTYPKQVTDAMAQYHEAVSSEPVNGAATGI